MKTEKITIEDVEVINTSANPEKITKVRVEDDENTSSQKNSGGAPSVEEFLEQMRENSGGGGMEDNPMMNMMGNIAEIKKIKPYFFVALLAGFWSLFGWTLFMAPLALACGFLDISLGSKLTQKASYIGMIFAIIGLMLAYKII